MAIVLKASHMAYKRDVDRTAYQKAYHSRLYRNFDRRMCKIRA